MFSEVVVYTESCNNVKTLFIPHNAIKNMTVTKTPNRIMIWSYLLSKVFYNYTYMTGD